MLALEGWLSAALSSSSIEPQQEAYLSISRNTADGGQLCISSSDPDTPLQYIDVVGPEQYPIGSTAPDFTLTSIEGEVYRLSELYGHRVVLVYFSTW